MVLVLFFFPLFFFPILPHYCSASFLSSAPLLSFGDGHVTFLSSCPPPRQALPQAMARYFNRPTTPYGFHSFFLSFFFFFVFPMAIGIVITPTGFREAEERLFFVFIWISRRLREDARHFLGVFSSFFFFPLLFIFLLELFCFFTGRAHA